MSCHGCKKPVAIEYSLCPYCGLPLKGTCPSCHAPENGDWQLCPKCGVALPEEANAANYPVPKRNRMLGGIIALAICVPIALLAVSIVGLGIFRYSTSNSMSGAGPATRWEDKTVYAPVSEWVDECDKQGKGAYVLELRGEQAKAFYAYTNPTAGMSLQKETYIAIVYLNQYKGTNSNTGFFGGVVEVYTSSKALVTSYETTNIANEKMETDYVLDYAISTGDKQAVSKFVLKIDGEEVSYKLTKLD
jgi:hypothetical protein